MSYYSESYYYDLCKASFFGICSGGCYKTHFNYRTLKKFVIVKGHTRVLLVHDKPPLLFKWGFPREFLLKDYYKRYFNRLIVLWIHYENKLEKLFIYNCGDLKPTVNTCLGDFQNRLYLTHKDGPEEQRKRLIKCPNNIYNKIACHFIVFPHKQRKIQINKYEESNYYEFNHRYENRYNRSRSRDISKKRYNRSRSRDINKKRYNRSRSRDISRNRDRYENRSRSRDISRNRDRGRYENRSVNRNSVDKNLERNMEYAKENLYKFDTDNMPKTVTIDYKEIATIVLENLNYDKISDMVYEKMIKNMNNDVRELNITPMEKTTEEFVEECVSESINKSIDTKKNLRYFNQGLL